LGYGDLVTVSEFGHLLAVSEAVLGQVFLVTFVAMIVARFVTQGGGRVPSADPDPDPTPSALAGRDRGADR